MRTTVKVIKPSDFKYTSIVKTTYILEFGEDPQNIIDIAAEAAAKGLSVEWDIGQITVIERCQKGDK